MTPIPDPRKAEIVTSRIARTAAPLTLTDSVTLSLTTEAVTHPFSDGETKVALTPKVLAAPLIAGINRSHDQLLLISIHTANIFTNHIPPMDLAYNTELL